MYQYNLFNVLIEFEKVFRGLCLYSLSSYNECRGDD